MITSTRSFLFASIVAVFCSCSESGTDKKAEGYQPRTKKDKNGNEYKTVTNDPYDARIYTLDNGLKVYMTVDREEPRVATRIAVRGGSASEQRETTGLAHYLEHMLFKGTDELGTRNWKKEKPLIDRISSLYEKRKDTEDSAKRRALYEKIDSLSQKAAQYAIPNEYDKVVSGMGGKSTNAYTSKDRTVYMSNIPANEVERWVKLERERFSDMVLRLFHTELETVFEEFNRAQDSDYRKARYALNKALYKGHPYQLSTLGSAEDLKDPSMENVHEFKKNYYVPNNMAICLAGDLNPAETFRTIKKHWGDMEPADSVPENRNYAEAEPINGPIEKEVQGPEAERVYFGYRFPADDSVMQRVELISELLYNGDAGLIDLNLIKEQKVLNASCYANSYNDYGLLRFYGQARPEQDLEDVRALLLKEVGRIKSGNFSKDQLKAIIRNKRKSRIQKRSSLWKVRSFVSAFTEHDPWEEKANYLEELKRITKEELVDFANDHFDDDRVVVYKRSGEDTSSVQIEKPPITSVDINRDDSSAFRKELEKMETTRIDPVFVDYEERLNSRELPSGIDMKYVKNKENKLFSVYYVLDIGRQHDKKQALAVEYLEKLGTDKYTRDEFEKKLYDLALDMNVVTGSERSYIILQGLPGSLKKGMELLEHLLDSARVDTAAYRKLVDNKVQTRKNRMKNKFFTRIALSRYGTYGKHSGFTDKLSEAELRAVDPANLVDRIHGLYDHEHYVFYYGQRDQEEVAELISAVHKTPDSFEPAPEKTVYDQRKTTGDSIFFVDYDMVQSHLTFVQRDAQQNRSLFPMGRLYGEYYGSGLSSVIFQEVRESKGLAYSSYATFTNPDTGKYHFSRAYLGTQADKLFDALDVMRPLLDTMKGNKQQFEVARENILKNIETERVTGTSILWNYMNQREEGFDGDKRRFIYNKVENADYEAMKRFFRDHIRDSSYDLLIMGDKDEIDMERLRNMGHFKEVPREDLFGFGLSDKKEESSAVR